MAYVAIPILLVSFARKRQDLPFSWMFVLFGAFIIGCGFTHFMEVVVFYTPLYRLAGLLKAITAVISVATVVALVPVIPKALSLRGPAELRREIDERLKAEERLQMFARELEQSNRELREFAMVASHDLQEPLRKIQAFGDRLTSRCGPALGDDGRDYLARMVNAAARMKVLIEDLLAYSQISTKAQPFSSVSLDEVAAGVVEDLEGRIAQTGGRVELAPLPTIRADPLQVRQLLQNLIGNGLKFHRPGVPPVIRVSARVIEPPPASAEATLTESGVFRPSPSARSSWKTTGSASTRSTPSGSSPCSRGSTAGGNSKARAWAWPSAGRSSRGTTGRSRPGASRAPARRS